MVGVPTAYLTALPFAIYLVSAFLLRAASGYPFSVVPAAAWIAVFTLVLRTISWSTRSLVVMMLGILVTLFAGGPPSDSRLDSFPNDVGLPAHRLRGDRADRRGRFRRHRRQRDAAASRRCAGCHRSTPGSGLWGWLFDLFRFPCPTSSATWAQVWLDLKFNGLPVLAIGVMLAIGILLVSAVGNPIDAAINEERRLSCTNADCFFARAWPVFYGALTRSVLSLARNAFGIRRRQGRAYMSVFEVTQAHGTAQLAVSNTRAVGLRPGRNHRDRRQRVDIGATVGRSGLHPDMGRASEQSAACHHRCRRSVDLVRAALTGGRGGGRRRHLGRGARRAWSAVDPLFPPREHRVIPAVAVWSCVRLAGGGSPSGIPKPHRGSIWTSSTEQWVGSPPPRWSSRPSTSAGAASRSTC